MAGNWRGLYVPRKALHEDTGVGSGGSCFAQHVSNALRRSGLNYFDAEPAPLELPRDVHAAHGYGLYSARFGNLYSSRQLRVLVESACGDLAGKQGRAVEDVDHWRQVVYARPLRLWLVVDIMQTAGSHSYTQVWKLPPPRGMACMSPGFESGQVMTDEAARGLVTTDDRAGAVNLGSIQFRPAMLSCRKGFGNDGLGYFSAGPLSDAVPAVDRHTLWRGEGPQVCFKAVMPFLGEQLPGQWQARSYTTAAGRHQTADGTQFDFEASHVGRKNTLWPAGPACDLVVRLAPAGKAAITPVIGAT